MRSAHDAALPSRTRGERELLWLGLLALGLLALPQRAAAPVHADATHIDAVNFNMDVDPGSASFLKGAIDTAQHDGASLLLINLDTPGGDLDSMKTIEQAELASMVPIVVYVSPSGGPAASAGTVRPLGAASQAELLSRLDGTSTTLHNGTTVMLHTAGLPVTLIEQSFTDQLKTVLFNPTVVFILFIVAAICIYLELAHPGAIVPGTVGVIALVLFLFGAGSLNPNWAGLVLMLLAIVLLAIDVRVPTHGVLTAGALVCLVVGSLIFFNSHAGSGGPTPSPLIIGAFAAGGGR